MKKILVTATCLTLLVTGLALAEKPVRNVSARRHPNIAAAQELARRAYDRISDAQRANEWDMGGHAQKAKELLEQVNIELKQAAMEANEHHRR